MIKPECEINTVEDCAPLSGGRPCASTALTVTVNELSPVDEFAETVNREVAAPPDTVTEAGFTQDGAGCASPETVQVKSTLPVKPLKGTTVTVEVAAPLLKVAGVSRVRVRL